MIVVKEPSDKMKLFIAFVNDIKKKMKKVGRTLCGIRISPHWYQGITGTKPHKHYDSEQSYGEICGVDIFVDERLTWRQYETIDKSDFVKDIQDKIFTPILSEKLNELRSTLNSMSEHVENMGETIQQLKETELEE